MNSAPVARTSLLILLVGGGLTIGGCQQPTNPAVPLSPVGPLGANTRVPPPQTGSYAVPNGYYQGQASTAPISGGQYAAVAGPEADYVATAAPSLNGWADAAAAPVASPAPAVASAAAVQPAAYHDAAAGPTSGFGAAPRIPASALQHGGAGGTPLRPNLGGMEVVDLTAPATLQPTEPPSLQVIERDAVAATANASMASAAPTFRSLSPAETDTAASGGTRSDVVVQASAREVRPPSASDSQPEKAASATAAPSTSKAKGVTESADLPWRKPLR